MRVRTHLDVVEISGSDVADAIGRLVFERTGREMAQITWVDVVEQRLLSTIDPILVININATLKPESE